MPARYVVKMRQLPSLAPVNILDDVPGCFAQTSQTKPGPNMEAAVFMKVSRSVSMLPKSLTNEVCIDGHFSSGAGALARPEKKKWLLWAALA